MAAARKGSAMKMRRNTPIFQTVRHASPSDGAASTGTSIGGPTTGSRGGVAQGGRLASFRGEHLLGQLDLLVAPPRWLAQAQADHHDDGDGHGKEEEGGAPRPDGGQAGAEEDAHDGADADARAVGRVDAWARPDRVVVRQQRVVGGEDHGLPHGDPDQHDGRHHHGLGRAEPDGERSADEGADERDAHPVGAVGQHGDGQRAEQRGRARDGHDEQDAGVGQVEGVADVRRQHVEGALGGLVEQLDRAEHSQGEETGAAAELGQALHGTRAGSTGVPVPGVAAPRRVASAPSAQSRRS